MSAGFSFDMQTIGIWCAIAFTTSLILVKILATQFQRRLVDHPNERSSHTQPTPRGGGIGFIFSFLIVMAIVTSLQLISVSLTVWLSLLPLAIIGFLDDWKDLPASIRYLVQVAASGTLVYQLGAFTFFTGQDNSLFLLKIGAFILTIIGITALINFYNFMDGLDGLVASTAIIQLSYLAFWGQNISLWLLAAAILGFLVWNWSPAKIFMGDSGSTFIGGAIAIALLSKDTNPSDAWAALTITLPITLDTIYTLIRRLLKGKNIFQAHRSHLFQRLHKFGWSHAQVASLYAIATTLSSITLLVLGPIGSWINLAGAMTTLIAIEKYLKHDKTPNSPISSLT